MSLPEPWGSVLEAIVGPNGVIVVLCVVIFFLWRLLREVMTENRANLGTLSKLTDSVKDLTVELRIWREGSK